MPSAALIVAGVGIILALVLGGVWLVRRRVPAVREGFDPEVSSQMLGIVATLFGLLLAFVVVLAFQDYSDAQDNVRLEADSVAQTRQPGLGRGRQGGHRRGGRPVRCAVVEDEWPRLRNGKSSPRASEGLAGLYAALQETQLQSAAQRAFYDDSVRRLNDLLSARRDRLSDASGGLSPLIVALLLVGTLVILSYVVLVGSRSAAFHAIGASAIALVLGLSLVVLLAYNYPYSGDVAMDPGHFREGILAQYFLGGR